MPVQVKTSGLAIAAFVLGILSLFTLGLTALPAMILGAIALVLIGKSGGRLTGTGFAITGIVIPAVTMVLIPLAVLMPALARTRQLAFRMTCGTNLSGIGKAMTVYANDYNGELPRRAAAAPNGRRARRTGPALTADRPSTWPQMILPGGRVSAQACIYWSSMPR